MPDKNRVKGSLEVLEEVYAEYKSGALTEESIFHKIVNDYPSFAVLYTFYDSVIKNKLLSLDEFIEGINKNKKRVLKEALKHLKGCKKVFTYSRSSQVKEAILSSGNFETVYITESRPNMEGTLLARELAESKIEVILGVDMMLEHFIKESNCVLLGSDAVFEKTFVNKIGSHVVIEIADDYKIPVFVFAIPEKKIKKEYEKYYRIEKEPPDEVARPLPGLIIDNIYFEHVPLSKVRLFI